MKTRNYTIQLFTICLLIVLTGWNSDAYSQITGEEKSPLPAFLDLPALEQLQDGALHGENTDETYQLLFEFPCGIALGESGIETDGEYIYTTVWNTDDFVKYTLDGQLVEVFKIDGVAGIRDLAYDGTFFYGAAADNLVRQMDFETKTLIGTITAPTIVRAIAYDNDANAFWANNWSSNPILFDYSGQAAGFFPIQGLGNWYGMAYYPEDQTIYGFSLDGEHNKTIVKVNKYTGEELEQIDMYPLLYQSTEYGPAGGLYTSNNLVEGYWVIGGMIQNESIFGIELEQINTFDNDMGVVVILEPLSGDNIGVEDLVVKYENAGYLPQTDIPVTIKVQGTLYSETIPLLEGGASVSINFGTYDFSSIGAYNLEAVVSLPNDEFSANDTLRATIICSNGGGGPTNMNDSQVRTVALLGENNTIIDFQSLCPGYLGIQTVGQYAQLYRGESYTLDVLFGTCGGSYDGVGAIWIDWNKDGIYDPVNELIGESAGKPGESPWDEPVAFTFEVPEAALDGACGLRVMQYEGGSLPLDPLASFSWGSVTDFSCHIIPDFCNSVSNFSVYSSEETVYLSWDAVPPSPDFEQYALFRDNELIAVTSMLSYEEMPGNGVYAYCVEAWYTNGCHSDPLCTELALNFCYAIENLAAEVVQDEVLLTWDMPAGKEEELAIFQVYRNGLLIVETEELMCVDIPDNGNYQYCVYALYVSGCVSDEVCVDVTIAYCAALENLQAAVTNNNVLLSWDMPSGKEEVVESFEIRRDDVLIGITPNLVYEDIADNGLYEYCVRTLYESGCASQDCCLLVEVSYCLPVPMVDYEQQGNELLIFWEEPVSPTNPVNHYKIYRDNELIGITTFLLCNDTPPAIGSYEYCVHAIYDDACESIGTCIVANYYSDPLYPPTNLTIEEEIWNVQGDAFDLLLSWEHPECGTYSNWLCYATSANEGYGEIVPFYAASRWEPSSLYPYDEYRISDVKMLLYPNKNNLPALLPTIKLFIWEGDATGAPLYEKELTEYVVGDWTVIPIAETLLLDADKELWIGLYFENLEDTSPLGYNSEETHEGLGNLISMDGVVWSTLAAQIPAIAGDWCLGVHLSNAKKSESITKSSSSFSYFELYDENELLLETTTACEVLLSNVPSERCYQVAAVYGAEYSTMSNLVCSTASTELENNTLSLYPNPADQNVFIESPSVIKQIELFNALGKKEFFMCVEEHSCVVCTEELPNGIYILVVETATQRSVHKVCIKH